MSSRRIRDRLRLAASLVVVISLTTLSALSAVLSVLWRAAQ